MQLETHYFAAMMIQSVHGGCRLSWFSIGDPQEVTGRIEDPEVCQAPWPVPEILVQWPSCCYDPVALSRDVVYLKYQFHANGRPPFCGGRRKWPFCGGRGKWLLSRPDVDRTTPQCDVGMLIAALIFRDGEAQNPGVKVNDDIEILRKDLKPQRHGHLRMVAHPSPRWPNPWPDRPGA